MLSDSNTRLVAARQLKARRARYDARRFLAEGAQAVHAALERPGVVLELFATQEARQRNVELIERARAGGVSFDVISARAAAGLSDTVTPQGLVAVCRFLDISLAELLGKTPNLVAALVEVNDPGNAGTVVRTADAAGADAVVLCAGVDVYNPKAVRASAGSLFHLDLVTASGVDEVLTGSKAGGLHRIATSGHAPRELPSLVEDHTLQRRTLWLFGSEAHGLPEAVLAGADDCVRVPLYGRAESLNLAAAAAVCLYASAGAQRARRAQKRGESTESA